MDIEEKLEDMGFSVCEPCEDIMEKLLHHAKTDPQAVYEKIMCDLRDCDYVLVDAEGKYYVTVTSLADFFYTNFPAEVIDDEEFRAQYQEFQDWFEDEGYDGWCGYGDRGGCLDDGWIIDELHELFTGCCDGSELKPYIEYGDDEFENFEDEI